MLAGRYAPGERLPTQRALAASLGVNMASVREGIKRLEQLKLVDVRQGDAMRVRDWRAHGGLDVLVHALGGGAALDDEVMRSVMEARGLLLADAARLAAERRDDDQAALLARLAGEVAAADGDEAAQGADFAFFATLIAASGNLVLLLVANSIRDLYFARLADFRALVRDREALAGLYARCGRRGRGRRRRGRRARGRRAHRRAGGRLAGGTGVRRREARAAEALVDAVAAPRPPLPPVAETDAVASFASWIALAPQPNRALLHARARRARAGALRPPRPRRPARAAAAARPLAARRGPARDGRGELLRGRGRAARARHGPPCWRAAAGRALTAALTCA